MKRSIVLEWLPSISPLVIVELLTETNYFKQNECCLWF